MSRENVETLHRVYEAFARGDFRSAVDIFDPHVVCFQRDDSNIFGRDVEGVYWGIAGLREYMRKIFEPFSGVTIEAGEDVDVGDSVVVAIVMRGVGKGSGVPVELSYFHLWTFRGGSVIRLDILPTREEAMKAVGMPE